MQYVHSLNCSLNLSLLTGTDAIKTFVAVYHLFTYLPPWPFERHMCTCLGQIYLGWFDMRGHKWHWADRTGPQSQAQLPEPRSRRVYCPQSITFQRLLMAVCGKLWQQGHKFHLIPDSRPLAWSAFCSRLPALHLLLGFGTSVPTLPPETHPERRWWCPLSWSLALPVLRLWETSYIPPSVLVPPIPTPQQPAWGAACSLSLFWLVQDGLFCILHSSCVGLSG